MSSMAPPYPPLLSRTAKVPAAAFEILGYLLAVAMASLCFVTGWLTVNGAVILAVILLMTLIVLSWIHLEQGRHPCFLLLCTLTLFQGGRLIAYCFGAEPQPMRVVLMGANFDPARDEKGLALLCVSLAAICIYAPSRWMFRHIAPPDTRPVQKYLPYLYLLFILTLPARLFKNYTYYEYAMAHGGYLSLFFNHNAIAATVPFLVRAVGLITFPVFIAIFVFERKKPLIYLTTIVYLATEALMLAIGSRGGIVALILTLWWVARVKSGKRARIVAVAALSIALLFVGDMVRKSRDNGEDQSSRFAVLTVISIEGAPLNMTEMAVKYREYFSRYSGSYLLRELENGFVAFDNLHYRPGWSLDFDASVLLNPMLFTQGNRVASSYIGEAYIAGGVFAVILVSLGVGALLAAFYNYSGAPVMLFVLALTLPDILILPRVPLLDWLSVLAKNLILIVIGIAGWKLYALITSITGRPMLTEPNDIRVS